MAIESAYEDLFSDTAVIFTSASINAFGKHTFSSSVSVPAHLVSESKLTVTSDGREVVQTGRVYLYGQIAVTNDSKIVLSDGSSPIIIGVDKPFDNVGWHHTVVRIGP